MKTLVKIIADSAYMDGPRLTTFEITMHRFVLAEFNTHRVFDRNSASSRAIPLAKQIERIKAGPAFPVVWASEQRGMSGGAEIEHVEDWLEDGILMEGAEAVWEKAAWDAIDSAERLGALGVHKSLANRLLEPFMWHTLVVTSTAWENFFLQRCHPDAQPEIRVVAEAMEALYRRHEISVVPEGLWHLPYIDNEDRDWAASKWEDRVLGASSMPVLAKISAARCAQLSYLTQPEIHPETGDVIDPGGKRDPLKDLARYEKLVTEQAAKKGPIHWSPLGHVATPWRQNRQTTSRSALSNIEEYRCPPLDFRGLDGGNYGLRTDHLPRVGNLLGWRSLRTEVEAQMDQVTFR